ncbi:MAG: BNR-4 repeat-containing protein [Kiritimatiellaeota bacterium]|nr:BNR-4 repeat-containing protein [Kiritimatiellota bacterium]
MKQKTILTLLAVVLVAANLKAADQPTDPKPDGKTASPSAFAAPADEPYDLKNQARQTSTLFTTKSITRNVMGECTPKVYKGNVYAIYMRKGDEVIMVAKVPLNESKAVPLPLTKNERTAPSDNHSLFILTVDRSGYIHVCGGMHSSKINYWRSDRPEDISSFTHIAEDDKLPPNTQPCPIAGSITYTLFFSDRHGQLFWTCVQGCGPLCSYDETKKLWTALGKPLSTVGAGRNRADNISFYYTDKTKHSTTDTTEVKGGLSKKHFSVAWEQPQSHAHGFWAALPTHLQRGQCIGTHHSLRLL